MFKSILEFIIWEIYYTAGFNKLTPDYRRGVKQMRKFLAECKAEFMIDDHDLIVGVRLNGQTYEVDFQTQRIKRKNGWHLIENFRQLSTTEILKEMTN